MASKEKNILIRHGQSRQEPYFEVRYVGLNMVSVCLLLCLDLVIPCRPELTRAVGFCAWLVVCFG